MPLGECIKQDFIMLSSSPTLPATYNIPAINSDCCFKMYVLAEITITDPLRNDKNDFIQFYSNSFSGATMKLQKYDGGWNDVKDLDNNDYGTYSAFGFFTNRLNEKGMGYLIDWQKILIDEDLGEGKYRIKTIETPLFGAVQNRYSWEYCLLTWTQPREDGTLKFEWNMNGRVGDPENDKKQRDFFTQNRYNQIRLGGDFGRPTSPFESEYVHYQPESPGDGKEVWIKHKFFDEYLLTLDPIPHYIHEFLKHDMMLGDDIMITDFNSRNPVHLIQKYVKPVTNWEPNWYFGNKLASVELKFNNLFQNASHKRS